MPDLALNYLHRNSYNDSEACVFIHPSKEGSPVDHKGNAITEDCDEYIEYLKIKVLPLLNQHLNHYRAKDVGLNDQGNHHPCFFVYRHDGKALSDLDITNLQNEVKQAINKINEKPGLFSKKKKEPKKEGKINREEKKSILKSNTRYSG